MLLTCPLPRLRHLFSKGLFLRRRSVTSTFRFEPRRRSSSFTDSRASKMSLVGKVAVVTGAAKGIGKAIAEIFLQNGAKVVLVDVDETTGKSLKKVFDQKFGEEKTLFIRCNVESEEEIKAAFERTMATFGSIDILCNNAGILSEDQWERTVSVNLGGVIRMTYAALEKMSQQSGGRGGVVVNTASVGGLEPLPSCPVYSATKHGVIGFTRAMAAASTASNYGIRFNTICPGAVQTDLFSSVTNCLGPFSHLAHLFEKFAEDGVLQPSDVARCVLELVTDEMKNGEVLVVDHSGKKCMTFPTVF